MGEYTLLIFSIKLSSPLPSLGISPDRQKTTERGPPAGKGSGDILGRADATRSIESVILERFIMKKIPLLVIVFLFAILPCAHAQNPTQEIREIVSSLVTDAAAKYSVDRDFIWRTLWCESRFDFSAIGDHGTSFGIGQIHQPAHPEISTEQAFNAAFSIDFTAREMSVGNAWKWSCFKKIFGTIDPRLPRLIAKENESME